VAASPDGKNLYVATVQALVRINRNPTTGAISQPAGTPGCISRSGDPSLGCAQGHGIDDPAGVAVSSDGKSVYVASFDVGAVARFNRVP
jgi:DNA-binding beta-propeller fold protein YncE